MRCDDGKFSSAKMFSLRLYWLADGMARKTKGRGKYANCYAAADDEDSFPSAVEG